MPSILNTPANKIPIHFFCLPVTQREILLVNVLTDPILYERIIASALYHNDPIFPQAITLFCNYVLICQMFSHLAIPHLPIQITEAFDPALSVAHTSMLVLLVDRGLSPSLRSSTGLTMVVTRWQRRFCSNQRMRYPNLDLPTPAPLDLQGTPPPPALYSQLTPLLTPLPNWLDELTPSLVTLELHLLFPQGNNIVTMLCQLNEAGEGLTNKVLLEWALDILRSPEDWRWLWSLEPATTPLSSLTLLNPSCLRR